MEVSEVPESTADPKSIKSFNLTFTHHGQKHTLTFADSETITDLSDRIFADLGIPPENQKFMITPKFGVLKHPFPNPSLSLTNLQNKKIILLAPLPSDISSLLEASSQSRSSARSSPVKSATPVRHRDWRKVQDEVTYTFHSILPLSYLPNPERSKRFLERLRDDAGIKASMRKHKFSVGVLTEMNPAEHTTHESRTLGLNRNRGEAIELRLRTDAYDGYRDYKVIRKTLCHELAHNVWGEHDRNFWDLTRDIEKEVEANDWRSGGHALTNEEFYNPDDHGVSGEHVDGGGWTGGQFVLGGTGGGAINSQGIPVGGVGRREAIAKAAEDRIKKQQEAGRGSSGELP
ncbi:MAG: hypothetical protein Q9191_003112 [Dirinaria sp. TL-2023a]